MLSTDGYYILRWFTLLKKLLNNFNFTILIDDDAGLMS